VNELYDSLQKLLDHLEHRAAEAHNLADEMTARASVYEDVATRVRLVMRGHDPAKQTVGA